MENILLFVFAKGIIILEDKSFDFVGVSKVLKIENDYNVHGKISTFNLFALKKILFAYQLFE